MIIYKTTNTVNNKIYIGKDSYNNPKYIGSGKLLWKAINKYGKKAFIKEIIERCSTQTELNEKEIYWIDHYDSTNRSLGYNISLGGRGGNYGVKFSEKTKKKMSNSQKGKHSKQFSEEHKQNISNALKGKTWEDKYGKERSLELKENLSKIRTNIKYSEEARKNMSIGHTGKKFSSDTKYKMRIAKLNVPKSEEAKYNMRKRWANLEEREKQSDRIKLSWEKRHNVH